MRADFILRDVIKKTIVGRFFFATVFLSLLPQTYAQELPLSEDDVVRLAGSHGFLEEVGDGHQKRGDALAKSARLWENPEISYERQQLFDDVASAGQDLLMLSQRFDLSGAREHRAAAAQARVGIDTQRLRMREHERETLALGYFFETLHAQHQLEIFEAWRASLEASLHGVATREAAGDASRYERVRLESELARARGRIEEATISRDVAWSRLETLTGDLAPDGAPWPRVQGELLPPELPPHDESVGKHIALLALDAEMRASEYEREAAALGWVPWLEVGAGYLHQDTGGMDAHGFAVTVTLPLNIFDSGQADAQRAEAEHQIAESEHALMSEQLERTLLVADDETERRMALARDFEAELERANEVVSIAEAGYAGGELRVSELIEAHSHLMDARRDRLTLQWQARQAWLRREYLRRAGGARD